MSLRKAAFSSSRWVGISLAYRAAIQGLQMLLLARILAPADFGLMAIAATFYGLISTFSDLGLSNALIHFEDPSGPQRTALYWLNLGASLLLAIALIFLAWPISHFYLRESLLPVVQLLALALPLSALGQQFRVLAEKNLRFSELAAIEIASVSFGFAAALLSAFFGLGVFSLVYAALAAAAMSSLLSWIFLSTGVRPYGPASFRGIGNYLRYGAYRLGENSINTVQNQVDLLVGGLVAPAAAMGMYATSKDISLRLANTLVNPIVTRVALPVMAQRQHDRDAVKSIYLQAIRLTASLNFPIYLSMVCWPEEIVWLTLGPQWQQASHYLRIFAIWGFIRSITNPVGSLLYATGRVRRAFWWNSASLLISLPLLAITGHVYALNGLATMMLALQILLFFPAFRFLIQPSTGAKFGEYLKAFSAPFFISVFSLACGFLASTSFPTAVARLVSGVFIAAIVYCFVSLRLNKLFVSAMSEMATPLLSRLAHRAHFQ